MRKGDQHFWIVAFCCEWAAKRNWLMPLHQLEPLLALLSLTCARALPQGEVSKQLHNVSPVAAPVHPVTISEA